MKKRERKKNSQPKCWQTFSLLVYNHLPCFFLPHPPLTPYGPDTQIRKKQKKNNFFFANVKLNAPSRPVFVLPTSRNGKSQTATKQNKICNSNCVGGVAEREFKNGPWILVKVKGVCTAAIYNQLMCCSVYIQSRICGD